MHVGVAYYPEHWDPARWPLDARLMRQAGINLARLAEFAWIRMEPEEGRYEFAWLDQAIETLAAEGIKVILGTPTEAMPAWVALKYPEVVAEDRRGHKIPYGARRDNCPTSAAYRLLAVRIAEAMARHYAGNPSVIGWQIDNEFSGPVCFCRACEAAWRDHLRERFGTIEELNRRWGTIFWSHSYRLFDEVQLPRREGGNPSLELEHRRFHSRQVVAFQKEQLDVLHRLSPGKPVTHNMCGFFVGDVDYYELARELDVASLDYYYNNGPWAERLAGVPYESAQMDLTRSLKKANFWVTETPTGPIGSQFFLRNLRPLEMRRMNFQALGHGADALVWFRWRTCLFGQEQYTHGILGHDGIPGRRYQDVARTAREFHALWPDLEGSVVQSEVAVVYVYDNRWALGIQPNARDFDYLGHLFQYYRALKREGVNVDFVGTHEPLDGYRAVVLPTGYVLTPEYAAKLTAFVANGGVLLATVRSGVKNEDNVPHEMTLPGLLHEVAGVRIDEYEALLERNPVRFEEALGGGVFEADRLCDWIVPESAEVLARHETEHLSAFAAVTVNQFGGGKAYYVGTCFVEDGPVRAIMRRVLDDAGVERPVGLPEGVNACMRQKGPERYLFVMNHNDHAVELDLGRLPPCRELVAGAPAGAMHQIAAGEVSVLHWKA